MRIESFSSPVSKESTSPRQPASSPVVLLSSLLSNAIRRSIRGGLHPSDRHARPLRITPSALLSILLEIDDFCAGWLRRRLQTHAEPSNVEWTRYLTLLLACRSHVLCSFHFPPVAFFTVHDDGQPGRHMTGYSCLVPSAKHTLLSPVSITIVIVAVTCKTTGSSTKRVDRTPGRDAAAWRIPTCL